MNRIELHSMSAHDENDWLDAALRESRPQALEDDGFAERVMRRLAVPVVAAQLRQELQSSARQNRRFERFTLIGAVAGCAIALGFSHWPDPNDVASAVLALVELRPVPVHALAPWLASLCSAGVLAHWMQKS